MRAIAHRVGPELNKRIAAVRKARQAGQWAFARTLEKLIRRTLTQAKRDRYFQHREEVELDPTLSVMATTWTARRKHPRFVSHYEIEGRWNTRNTDEQLDYHTWWNASEDEKRMLEININMSRLLPGRNRNWDNVNVLAAVTVTNDGFLDISHNDIQNSNGNDGEWSDRIGLWSKAGLERMVRQAFDMYEERRVRA